MQGLPKIGDVLDGTYEIEELIGTGGFGAVYRARQLSMNRDVALKILVAHAMQVEEMIQRFRREVMAVRNLGHPNTIRIYDFRDRPDGLLYYAMEYVNGPTLKEVIKERGPIPPARTVHILRQVAKSLAEAHSFGIIHRDLKPANIMLADIPGETDFVKVVDFGIAKIVGGEDEEEREQLTSAGVLVGTLHYMSPEQIAGGELGPESDLYALALIGIEMLTGKSVFAGTGRWEILHKQISDEPVEVPEVVQETPLGPIFERALQKRPTSRYSRAEEILSEFEDLGALPDEPLVEADTSSESDHESAVSGASVPDPQHTPRPTGPSSDALPRPTPDRPDTGHEPERPRLEVPSPKAPEAPADATLPEPDPFEEAKTEIRDSGLNPPPATPERPDRGVEARQSGPTPPGDSGSQPRPSPPPAGPDASQPPMVGGARPVEPSPPRARTNSSTPAVPGPTPTSIADEPTMPEDTAGETHEQPPPQFESNPALRAFNDVGTTGVSPADAPSPGKDDSSNRVLIVIAGVTLSLVLVLAAATLYVAFGGDDEPPEDTDVTTPEVPVVAEAKTPELPDDPVEVESITEDPEEPETPEPPEEPKVERKTIRLVTPGVTAEVYEEGELLGETPLRFPVGAPAKYTLSAEGRKEVEVELSNESDDTVKVEMERTGGKKAGGKSGGKKGSDDWFDVPTKKTDDKKKKDEPSVPVF